MAESFDPYYTWLGIPPDEQPPDYYRLLGVRRFESNSDVIQNACDQRIAFVRSFQNGPRMRQSQQLLNEIAAAAASLLDPGRKSAYDDALRSVHGAGRSVQPSHPRTVGYDATTTAANSIAGAASAAASLPQRFAAGRRPRRRNLPVEAVKVVLGGIAGILLGALVLHYFFGINVDGILRRTDQAAAHPVADDSPLPAARRGQAGTVAAHRATVPSADTSAGRSNAQPLVNVDASGVPSVEPPNSETNLAQVATSLPASPSPAVGTSTNGSAVSPPADGAPPPPLETIVAAPTRQTPPDAKQPPIPPLPRQAVVAEIPQASAPLGQMAFRPDGKMIASWNSQGKEIALWTIGGSPSKTAPRGSQIVFASDSRQFAVVQSGQSAQSARGVMIYRVLSGGKLSDGVFLPITETIRSVAFSDDGKQLFVAMGGPRPLAAYVLGTQKLNDRIKTTLSEVGWIGTQGDLLVCSTTSGRVETIAVSNARQHESLPEELGSVPILLFDQRGSPTMLATSESSSSQLTFDQWNLKSKTRVTTPVLAEGGTRSDLLAVSNDGQLAAIRDQQALTLVRVSSGEQVTQLRWPEGDFQAAALTTSAGLLAVNGPANYLWIIDLGQVSAQPCWRVPPRDERLALGYRAVDPPVGDQEVAAPAKTAGAATQRGLPKGVMDAVFVKPGTVAGGGSDLINGWEFIPKTAITITHLGIYDHRPDGLAAPHEVAIWDVDEPKAPLVMATVPPGMQAPLAGMFRMAPVSRIMLEAGRNYAVVAHYPDSNDQVVSMINPSGLVIEYAPQLTVVARRYGFPHRQMAFPVESSRKPVDASIGPTFRFEVR